MRPSPCSGAAVWLHGYWLHYCVCTLHAWSCMDLLLCSHFSEASVISCAPCRGPVLSHPVLSGIEAFLLGVALDIVKSCCNPTVESLLARLCLRAAVQPCLVAAELGPAAQTLGYQVLWGNRPVEDSTGVVVDWIQVRNYTSKGRIAAGQVWTVLSVGEAFNIENPVFSPFKWGVVATSIYLYTNTIHILQAGDIKPQYTITSCVAMLQQKLRLLHVVSQLA